MPARRTRTAHPLEHLIPPMSVHDEYVSRFVAGSGENGLKDLDLMRYAREAERNVSIAGPTGDGKSTMVRAFCASERLPLVTINANGGIDPTTFWGMPQPLADRTIAWQDSDVTIGIRHGQCVICIEEANFLKGDVSAAFHSLTDSRRCITILENGNEFVQAGEGIMVVMIYNPGYNGTRPLNQAFKNRFAIKLQWDYDQEVEKQLVCIPVMLEIAEKLRFQAREGEIITPVSTNMLQEFELFGIDLGLDFAVTNFVNAFEPDEQQAVREVLDSYSAQIREQLDEWQDIINNAQEEE